MPKNTPRFRAALEKRHFLNPRFYVSALPIMLVASVAVSIRDVNLPSLILYTGANIASLGLCVLVFLAARWALLRSDKQSSSIWQLMALGLALGVTKFISTAWLVFALGLELDLQTALESRIGTPLLGIWVVIVVGYITASKEQFSLLRERLVNEKVAKSLDELSPKREASLAELESFLEESRRLISASASKAQDGAQLATLIRQIVDRGLRPLSHKLWERENQSVPSFQSAALIQRALSSGPYPVLAILGILLISNLGGNFREATFLQGLSHLGMQMVFVGIVLVLANQIKVRLPRNNLVTTTQLLVVSAIAGLGSSLLPELLIPTQNTSNLWLIGIVSAWWIGTLLVSVGAVAVAIKDNREQREALEELLKADLEKQAKRSQALLANRELANHLHSNIQNQLLAQALRLEEAEPDDLNTELANLERILSEARSHGTHVSEDLSQLMQELKSRWGGLLAIEHTVLPELTAAQSRVVGSVISEAIGNAFRHGFANQIHIEFEGNQGNLVMTIRDNGLGPRSSNPGLGSVLYDSAGSWRLEPSKNGGSQLSINFFDEKP